MNCLCFLPFDTYSWTEYPDLGYDSSECDSFHVDHIPICQTNMVNRQEYLKHHKLPIDLNYDSVV